MQIRECAPGDLEQVTHLWLHSGPPGVSSQTGDLVAWLSESNPGLCLVGEVRAKIVAAIAAAYDGFAGCVHHLAVAPEFQRLGYGRPLLAEVEQRLARLGCRRVHLRIPTNHRAVLGFYFALGYDFERVISIAKLLPLDETPVAHRSAPAVRPLSPFARMDETAVNLDSRRRLPATMQ